MSVHPVLCLTIVVCKPLYVVLRGFVAVFRARTSTLPPRALAHDQLLSPRLTQKLWDHYALTQDCEYLERYAYPVRREISEFWIDHLKELPGGTLVAPEGRSPEHGPVGLDGVTYDQVLC